jgi:hypothetical protein
LSGMDHSSGWRKSSFSASGDCLEWRMTDDGVHLRDSKDHSGAMINLSLSEWAAFVAGIKAGEADQPS